MLSNAVIPAHKGRRGHLAFSVIYHLFSSNVAGQRTRHLVAGKLAPLVGRHLPLVFPTLDSTLALVLQPA